MNGVKVNADGSISIGSFCEYTQGEATRPASKAETTEVKDEPKAETTTKKKTTAKAKG